MSFTLPLPPARSVLVAAVTLACALGLLAGLGRVAREAVRQGDLRHEATARHSQATWQCNTLRNMRLRDTCLRELNAPPPARVPVDSASR